MLLWSSSLAFVLFQMTSSQTTSFFKFHTHTFPPSLLPSKWLLCSSTFTFCHCYFIFPFLSSTTHPCVCSSTNSSIHFLRTETKVQLYCPVYGEHATIVVVVQSFYAFPPHLISFPPVFYLYFMQLWQSDACTRVLFASTQVLNVTF